MKNHRSFSNMFKPQFLVALVLLSLVFTPLGAAPTSGPTLGVIVQAQDMASAAEQAGSAPEPKEPREANEQAEASPPRGADLPAEVAGEGLEAEPRADQAERPIRASKKRAPKRPPVVEAEPTPPPAPPEPRVSSRGRSLR